jgi:hypothetical protein
LACFTYNFKHGGCPGTTFPELPVYTNKGSVTFLRTLFMAVHANDVYKILTDAVFICTTFEKLKYKSQITHFYGHLLSLQNQMF